MADEGDVDPKSTASEANPETRLEGQGIPSEKNISASSPTPEAKPKIDILLKATADAPIMKKKKWSVAADKKVGWVIQFIHRFLKLEPSESLFLYVNQAFAPSPDQVIQNLYDCFGSDGKLVLHYCKTQAWG